LPPPTTLAVAGNAEDARSPRAAPEVVARTPEKAARAPEEVARAPDEPGWTVIQRGKKVPELPSPPHVAPRPTPPTPLPRATRPPREEEEAYGHSTPSIQEIGESSRREW
jgi:hypothetical protein